MTMEKQKISAEKRCASLEGRGRNWRELQSRCFKSHGKSREYQTMKKLILRNLTLPLQVSPFTFPTPPIFPHHATNFHEPEMPLFARQR